MNKIFDRYRVTILLSLVSMMPGLICSSVLLHYSSLDWLERITIFSIVVVLSIVSFYCFYISATRPWQSFANMLRALIEEDFSQRALSVNPKDPIGLVGFELNNVARYLQENRFKVRETQELLLKVLDNVDMSVFLFDHHQRLVMINGVGASLYAQERAKLIGKTVDQLGLSFAQMAVPTTSHEHQFPAKKSRWWVRNSAYREGGLPHSMILLADISQSLREEELTAWKRLIRVLSHEINNAMTPMRATVGGLQRILAKKQLNAELTQDFSDGLEIIDRRVDNLSRHIQSYSQIARQADPNPQEFSILALFRRVQHAFAKYQIHILVEHDLRVFADEPQVEQVLINLVNNSIEAQGQAPSSSVRLNFGSDKNYIYLYVDDSGPGIENLTNIFIPYFTTKSSGSGVGLFISRQIIEAHGGYLHLDNLESRAGCIATIALPTKISRD